MKTLLLIDGSAIMYRAFYALPEMTTKEGLPKNAIYGFFMMLHKVIQDFKPEDVVVCFDTPTRTFRKDLSKEYQAHRPKMDDKFAVQIPYIRKLLDAGGVPSMEAPGFEADDVIGTLTERFKKDHRVLILTGDKDIMQLIDEHVFVIAPKIGLSSITLYDIQGVVDKLGVRPEKIPDYKALAGDPSDNYPGAKGIGPKTAIKLINEFGNVETLLEKLETLPEGRTKELIKEHIEDVKLSKTLATIIRDVKIDMNEDQITFKEYNPKMRDELIKLELFTVQSKLFNVPLQKKEIPKETKEEKKADPTDQQSLF